MLFLWPSIRRGGEPEMRIRRPFIHIFILLMLLSPVRAWCEEKPLWELGAGLLLLQMPDYRGSDENRRYLLPYPYFVYRGDILRVERERISGRIFETDRLLLDISLNGNVPVNSSENPDRRGMADLDPTFEIGPSLNVTLLENRQDHYKLKLTLPIRAAFSTDFSSVRHEGWVFHPRLVFEKADMIAGSGVNLGISAGPMFADRGYHRYFYAVDPPYATPARRSYEAGGGYSGSTLTVGLNKNIKPFIISAFVSLDFLQGATFEGSPLVKNKYAVMTGITVSWVFLTSSRMVE
ncbi:MAG: MipA/OmpV family protein [Syntrophobacterales bacterium CG_4_8_14_3_um_filter_58_8]|nr:MAG: MipA/OmpV family protein [Syntrophobacterales bacterium CG_4_8_14_3_um_filter_58_8]